jgi:hypothetical protein
VSDRLSVNASAAVTSSSVFASGTPTQAGTFLSTIRVNDQLGSILVRIKITVCPENITLPFICDTALLEAEPNIEYSDFITVVGGTAPYNFGLLGKAVLPLGLSLNNDGTVTGIPSSSAKTKKFTVQVTDPIGSPFSRPLSLTMLKSISITGNLKKAKVGKSYSAKLKVKGGLAPIFWSATDLPAGLAIDSSTGVVSGIPQAPGKFTINFQASDALQGQTARAVTLTVGP